MRIVVDIADMKTSRGDGNELITHALGSCIGLALYDPTTKIGGLLHYMLPDSSINKAKAQKNPYMFADTGIPLLVNEMVKMGANKKKIIVKVAGGSNVLDTQNVFNIGKKNFLALKKILWKLNMRIHKQDVGGTISRTVILSLSDGSYTIKSPGKPEKVI